MFLGIIRAGASASLIRFLFPKWKKKNYFSFYRQFRLCITNASGKAHTPKVARALRLSLRESSRGSG